MLVHTKTPKRREPWYLDSGCSRHMTWDINNFATLSRYHEGGTVTFGDDSKDKIIGIGNIKIGSSRIIKEGLRHNHLSFSQLCDRGFKIVFDDFSCDILDKKTNTYFSLVFMKIMFI